MHSEGLSHIIERHARIHPAGGFSAIENLRLDIRHRSEAELRTNQLGQGLYSTVISGACQYPITPSALSKVPQVCHLAIHRASSVGTRSDRDLTFSVQLMHLLLFEHTLQVQLHSAAKLRCHFPESGSTVV